MNVEEAREQISNTISRLLKERREEVPPLAGDTKLLGGELPIDSLDLAAIVVELQEATGEDPFHAGFINFRTIDELAKLFSE